MIVNSGPNDELAGGARWRHLLTRRLHAAAVFSCKQQRDPRVAIKLLFFLKKPGAGEANRTPDPNLGKVMLYP
jgi:hypothetical protein